MTQQNLQNNMFIPAVHNQLPVQGSLPAAQIQGSYPQNAGIQPQPPAQTAPNNNYIPRYASMMHQGQFYSVPVPQQQQMPQKGGSVGTVNISINGVNPPGSPAAQPMPQYYPVPYYIPTPQPVQQPVQQSTPQEPAQTMSATKMDSPKEQLPAATQIKKPPVVELTDQYIMGLERNLRSDDKETRAHAVAELLNRFKEDESRKTDIRLTKLLNLALQDDSKPIVFAAMQPLSHGYALGDAKTVDILKYLADQNDSFGNSETAQGVLSELAGRRAAYSATSPIKDSKGTRLNVVSE